MQIDQVWEILIFNENLRDKRMVWWFYMTAQPSGWWFQFISKEQRMDDEPMRRH